ncbi:hypothetical protein ABQE69_09185 [Mycolicibacillus trivialis]
MKPLIWLWLASVMLGAALFYSVPASASPSDICAMLDRTPTTEGLIDTVAAEVVADDLAPSKATEVVVDSITSTCPRHIPLLQRFVDEQRQAQGQVV